VRHIDHQPGADFVRDLAHAGKINYTRIGAATADNHFGALPHSNLLHFIVIDGFCVLAHSVRNDFVHLAGEIERVSVREMSAVSKVQAHYRIARL
jgi:hypothetical protein